jgi:hypothetical protein
MEVMMRSDGNEPMAVLDEGQLWFRCRACGWHSQPRSVRGAGTAAFFAAWDAAEADWTAHSHACGTGQPDTMLVFEPGQVG